MLRCARTGLCSTATPTVIAARRSTICLIAPCSRSTAVIGQLLPRWRVRCWPSTAPTPTPRICSRLVPDPREGRAALADRFRGQADRSRRRTARIPLYRAVPGCGRPHSTARLCRPRRRILCGAAVTVRAPKCNSTSRPPWQSRRVKRGRCDGRRSLRAAVSRGRCRAGRR